MKDKIPNYIAIIAVIFALICCIGPVLLAGLSVGSLALFSSFNSLRPVIIIVSIVLLIPAFYFAYRKRVIKCEDGSCITKNSGKWNKIIVWLAALFFAGFTAFLYWH